MGIPLIGIDLESSEAATQVCSWEKMFWEYAANFQENTRAEKWFHIIEITLRHGCSPVNLLHIFATFCYEHLWTTASEKRFEVDFIVGVSLIKELSVNYFRKNVHLKCLKGF